MVDDHPIFFSTKSVDGSISRSAPAKAEQYNCNNSLIDSYSTEELILLREFSLVNDSSLKKAIPASVLVDNNSIPSEYHSSILLTSILFNISGTIDKNPVITFGCLTDKSLHSSKILS